MKTIDANLTTHLAQTVTTLATIWRITREDDVSFFFTDHDQDLEFPVGSGTMYKASTGYNRTALAVNAQLSVDNLDIEGIYADAGIDETELRAGLFDYADVEISMVNWSDLSQGELKLKKGRLGEVQISTQGFYTAEVRGLTQQLSQTMLQIYQPECRVDLGSPECGIPILPDILNREQAVALGEFYRVPTGNGTAPSLSLLQNGNFEADGAGSFTSANPPSGWEIVGANAFEIIATEGGLNPDSGTYFMRGAAFDSSEEIRQDVDIIFGTLTQANVDAGNVSITFTSSRANSFSSDTGRVRVEFLNSSKSLISTGLDTGLEEITPTGTWVSRDLTSTVVPVNTKYIRVRLDYSLVSGTSANSCFDNLTLVAIDSTVTATIEEPLDDPSFDVDTAGTYSTSVQMTDWTIISGSWDLVTSNNGLSPFDGTKFLIGTDTFSTGELEQSVDLIAEGFTEARINANGLKAYFSIQRANSTSESDTGRVRVECLDSNNVVLSTVFNTGFESFTQDVWNARVMPVTALPRDTRKVRVSLEYSRFTGTQSFAAFDDALLVVFDDEHSLYENRVYEVTTAGTTAVKQPTYNLGLGVATTDGTAVLTSVDAFMRHGVVSSVVDRRMFTVAVEEPRAVDGWFKNGSIHFYDGDNTGQNSEIKEWSQSSGLLELYLPLPYNLPVGTRVRLYRGCQKRLDDDCVAIFNNALNFKGEPFIPGSDAVLGYPSAR